MLTNHALSRMVDRFTEQELTEAVELLDRFTREHPEGSHAVKVTTLTGIRGKAWSDTSNGEVLWAIVRGGAVVTTFLRRSTQPATPQNLQVQRVWAWY